MNYQSLSQNFFYLALEKFLDNLESTSSQTKQKRDIEDTFVLNDEIGEAPVEPENKDRQGTFDVKTTIDNVQMPMKGGSPAFSIHASKVYILYPSLFQDPNIFGRFSIPQNINLDPLPDKSSSSKTSIPTSMIQQPEISNEYGDPLPSEERKMFRRQAEPFSTPIQQSQETKPASRKGDKKRNVETHLTGTIVVLNQDVNENNQKESY